MTRRRNWREVERRVNKIETAAGAGEVQLLMPGGARVGIRRRNFMPAFYNAVFGEKKSIEANAILHAVESSDGSLLYQLAQALASGPAPASTSTNNTGETE